MYGHDRGATTSKRERTNRDLANGTKNKRKKQELIYVYRVTVCLSISQGKTQWNLP
jgi:hypothetical protein